MIWKAPYRWTWAADAVLALVLAVGTVSADLDRTYVGEPRKTEFQSQQDAPAPPGIDLRDGPDVPAPPGIVLPEGSEVPDSLARDQRGIPPDILQEHSLGSVPWWGYVLAVLTALPLALRRRYPLGAFWTVLAADMLFHFGEVAQDATAVTFASVLIAAYSAAMYSPHRKAAAASLLAGTVLLALFNLVPEVGSALIPLLVLAPIALAANGLHSWRQRVRTMQAEQEAATRVAVDQERHRIARELHDVVTHNVSMMTIQAGAARKVLDTSPEQAREAMLAVESAGRSAMSELRQVMGLLTMAADGPDPAATADLAPQPGLDRLTELVDRVRATGSSVAVSTSGTPVPLPPGVDLAGYRVVQEALTNAVKHASGSDITVLVEYATGELRIRVDDTGGTPLAAEGNGRGLIGLRERLAVYGGTLQTGKRPRGGYRVRAVIPVEVP